MGALLSGPGRAGPHQLWHHVSRLSRLRERRRQHRARDRARPRGSRRAHRADGRGRRSDPEPSPIDAPLPDWLEDAGDVVLRTLVRVERPGRAVRLSITMDESLAGAVDRAAAARGFTRSGFLAEAARRMLRERTEPPEPAR